MKKPISVAITGAAGQIGYSLLSALQAVQYSVQTSLSNSA